MHRLFEGTDHARAYAQFRPSPPGSLITSIRNLTRAGGAALDHALDVGCGSGQNTRCLAAHFRQVTGSDVSAAQVQQARDTSAGSNVQYVVAAAEQADVVRPGSVQLVTAAVCAHYLDKPRFFAAADRALAAGGVLALYGNIVPRVYRAGEMWPEMSQIMIRAREATWPYWEHTLQAEIQAKFTDEKYRLPYPDEVREDGHFCERPLSLELVLGLISTWSGIQTMRRTEGEEAAKKVLEEAESTYRSVMEQENDGAEADATVRWIYFLVMARKPK